MPEQIKADWDLSGRGQFRFATLYVNDLATANITPLKSGSHEAYVMVTEARRQFESELEAKAWIIEQVKPYFSDLVEWPE